MAVSGPPLHSDEQVGTTIPLPLTAHSDAADRSTVGGCAPAAAREMTSTAVPAGDQIVGGGSGSPSVAADGT